MSIDPATADDPCRLPDQPELLAADLLKDDFGWSLGVILRRYRSAEEEIVRDVPGGPRGYQVIASASQNLATNQAVMAAQLGIDRTMLTYLIDELEAAGLVSRQPDPQDRRNRRVTATGAGRALWRDRRCALVRAESEILAALGDEAPVFKRRLQRVAKHADHLDATHNARHVVERPGDD
jgi:DNA-binding MarR family transcriptional regulator